MTTYFFLFLYDHANSFEESICFRFNQKNVHQLGDEL